jgi:hypothetical protein
MSSLDKSSQRRFFSFYTHAVARLLILHNWNVNWTRSAIFSASLSEPNSRLTAHLELRNSTADSESESYITTDGQSASLSWNKAPIWGLRPDFYYCQIVAVCCCGALSLTRARFCRVQFMFTGPLLRNELHNPVLLLTCFLWALPSNGRCFQSHCLATGLYATVWIQYV